MNDCELWGMIVTLQSKWAHTFNFPLSSCLAPRCRLFATWGCSMLQGLGCSPIKAVRELGSERREIVRSISGVGVRALRGPFPSTRGPGRTHLWCTSYRAHGKRWVAKCGADNCWKHLSIVLVLEWGKIW